MTQRTSLQLRITSLQRSSAMARLTKCSIVRLGICFCNWALEADMWLRENYQCRRRFLAIQQVRPVWKIVLQDLILLYVGTCRFQWPPGLRRGSAAARFLGLWVRIQPGTWMCLLWVLSGGGLCVSADYSSRGFLRSVVCLSVMMNPR